MIHLEKYHLDEMMVDDSETIAWCGKRATLHANGKVTPDGYNFVTREWPNNATCEECKENYASR